MYNLMQGIENKVGYFFMKIIGRFRYCDYIRVVGNQ